MWETEITVQVFGSKEAIQQKLEAQGFNLEHHTIMTDWYFSKLETDALKKLSYENIIKNSLIVRELNIDGKIKSLLHFKDKEFDEKGNVITEEKLTEQLTSAPNCAKLLNSAGFNNWICVVQDMYIYTNGNMHFALQIVDGLGIYIEYEEDESVAGLNPHNKVETMLGKLKGLGLNLGSDTNVKKVYEKFKKESAEYEI